MIRKTKILLLSAFLLFMVPDIVFGSDYTSSDPTKNNFYQRIDAIDYAAEFVTNHNPNYPYFWLRGNCTNYVSQCIYDGGMPQIDTSSYALTRQWYMHTYLNPYGVLSYSNSATGTAAHNFRYHWANVNDTGWNRCYQYKIYSSAYALETSSGLWNDLYYRCSAGDVIQYVYGPSSDKYGTTWHSQLVQRRSRPNTDKKISMGQNSSDGWRNLRVDSLPNVADDTIICLIRIKEVQRPIDTVNP